MPTSPDYQPSFSSARRWTIGLNVMVSVAAALALVLMVNYLAARHFTREHLNPDDQYKLSALTLQLLQSTSNQVKVVVFFDKEDSLYSSVSSLLNEYQLASPRLAVEYVDYLRNPGAAQLIKERYKLDFGGDNSFRNLIIFDSGSARKIIYDKELYDLDFSDALAGKSREVRRSDFKGELVFTSAILSVTESRRPKAYFLAGHGEKNPLNDEAVAGYSQFATLLQQNNIQVETLVLGANGVPPDCQLLIIAGPRNRYEPKELEQIDDYLDHGGRLLALLNNIGRSGLERVLANWGVQVDDDLVFDTQTTGKSQESIPSNVDMVVTNYPTQGHPIVRPLLQSRLHLFLARSVDSLPTAKQDADAPRVDVLAASSQSGVAMYDIRDGTAYPNPLRDRHGEIPVIVAVEKGSVQGISPDRGSTRMVVAGDSTFLGNQLIDSLANRDFALLAVNWLLDRSRLMGGIGPRPIKEFRLVMTQTQITAVRWILLAGLPGSVLLIGVLVWLRRQN